VFHQPITEDPRATAAVSDFRESVIEIRQRSARWFGLADGSDERAAEQAAIDDLVGAMQARCDRIDLTLDELFVLINADLDSSRADVAKPRGDFARSLLDEATRAHAAERQLQREIARYERLLIVAVDARLAADRACAGYAAGWAKRGAR
jgi:hypothetical protein